MANVKITDLPSTTYVSQSSVVPVVVGGVTKKMQFNPLTIAQSFAEVTAANFFATAGVFIIQSGTYAISGASVTIPSNSVVIAENVVFAVTLDAVADNNKPALDIGSNVTIIGSIGVAVTITGGTPASFDTGTIRMGTTATGVSNIKIGALTYTGTSTPNNWNAVLIQANSHDIDIGNIEVAGGGTVSRAVLLHWTGSSPTLHPYNVTIGNVLASGGYQAATDGAAVFFSSAYNVDIGNIQCSDYHYAAVAYAGDYGNSLAATAVQPLIGYGLTIHNIDSRETAGGVKIDGLPTVSGSSIPIPLHIINANMRGYGTSDAAKSGSGIEPNNCRGVTIDSLRCTNFYFHGIGFGDNVIDFRVSNPEIHDNGYNGAYLSSSSGGSGIQFNGGSMTGNGISAAGDSFVNGIFVNNYTDTVIVGTRFGNTAESFQKFGVQANSAALRTHVRDTYVAGVKAGGTAYFFGDGSGWRTETGQYMVDNARYVSGITGFGGTFTCTSGYNGLRTFYGTSIPTAITGVQGEQCINMSGTVGQPRAWTCSSAGTPGTWTSWGNL